VFAHALLVSSWRLSVYFAWRCEDCGWDCLSVERMVYVRSEAGGDWILYHIYGGADGAQGSAVVLVLHLDNSSRSWSFQ
jgi:hypothetical protein